MHPNRNPRTVMVGLDPTISCSCGPKPLSREMVGSSPTMTVGVMNFSGDGKIA